MQGVKLISEKSGLPESHIDKIFRQRYLSVAQVAELLHKSQGQIRVWCGRHKIEPIYPYPTTDHDGPLFVMRDKKLIDTMNEVLGTNIKWKEPEANKNEVDSMAEFARRFNDCRKDYGKKKIGRNFGNLKMGEKAKRNFRKAHKTYSVNEMIAATIMAFKDEWHIENKYNYLTMEFILRSEIVERYVARANMRKEGEND